MKKSVFIVLTIIFTYFFNVSIIQAIENYTIDTFIYSFDDYKILNQIVSFGSDSAYQEYESSPFTLYGVPCHAKVELWEGKVEAVNIVFDEIDQSIYDIIDRISILFGSYQNIDEEGDVFYWENNNVSITLGIHEPPAYIVLNRITFEDETDSYKEYYSSFGEVLQYHLDDRNLNCMQYEPYIGIQYCYCDITGDGIDELIVNRQIGKHGYTLYIYQDNGNDVEVLGSLEHDGGYIFAADNSLIVLYDDELSVLTWNGDKVTENILYINDEYNDLEELVAEELNLDDVYLIRDWINLINENEDNTEDYSDKVFIDSEKSNTLTVKTSEVSKDADKDERYNLNLYVYRMVTAPEGQSTLVFQKEPRGAFMNDYAFHSGDTIYVNDSWRNDGYAIAYQDGVYGYVDESYIDWSSDDTESTDNNPDIHESEQSDSSLMKKTKNDVEVKKDESNAEYMRWCFENNNGEPIDFSGIIGQNIYDYEDLFDEMRIKELEKTDEIIKRGNDGIAITCNGKGTIVRARIDGPDIDYRFGSFYIDVMPSNNIKDYIYELGLDSYDELMIDDWMIYTGKDKFFAFCKSEDGLYIKSMYYGLVGYCPFDLDKAVVTEGISKQKPDIIGKINYDTDLWNDLVDYNSDVEIYDKSIPAIIKVNEDDYNIFVHGSENDTELSVKRSGYVDLIKILFDDSAHVITATLIGEDITSDFTYGNINVIPDYFLLAEQPFEYLIENNDPVFLGSILGNMGVSSLDEVSVITNGDFTFLYNEGMLSNNHFYSEYVTLKGTTLIEIYAESGLDHNEPQVRQLSRYLKDSILYYDGDYSYEASKYSQTKKADTVYLNQYLGKQISDLPDMFNLSAKKRLMNISLIQHLMVLSLMF